MLHEAVRLWWEHDGRWQSGLIGVEHLDGIAYELESAGLRWALQPVGAVELDPVSDDPEADYFMDEALLAGAA